MSIPIIELMFKHNPQATFLLMTGIVGFPYFRPIKDYFYPPKSFEDGFSQGYKDGVEEGYKSAQKELRDQASKGVKQTMDYIKEVAQRVKEKKTVLDDHLKGKVAIHLLPRWTITLLKDDYVIRRPLRADHGWAWMMKADDSEEMDKAIRQALEGTKFAIDENKMYSAQNKLKKDIQSIIEESCDKVLK